METEPLCDRTRARDKSSVFCRWQPDAGLHVARIVMVHAISHAVSNQHIASAHSACSHDTPSAAAAGGSEVERRGDSLKCYTRRPTGTLRWMCWLRCGAAPSAAGTQTPGTTPAAAAALQKRAQHRRPRGPAAVTESSPTASASAPRRAERTIRCPVVTGCCGGDALLPFGMPPPALLPVDGVEAPALSDLRPEPASRRHHRRRRCSAGTTRRRR